MAVSMTGFGMGQLEQGQWHCTTEIRTVNNRFLDVNIRLPTGFQQLTPQIKKTIKETCIRGKVDCTISLAERSSEDDKLILNESLAKAYQGVMQQFQDITGNAVQVQLCDLVKIPEMIQSAQPDAESDFFASLIQQSLGLALKQMAEMRIKEGQALMEDIQLRLKMSSDLLTKIEAIAPTLPDAYYKRLSERLPTFDSSIEIDCERINKEIALFADRCDITEEITRFRTHLEHMASVLKEKEVGRRADFLLQEFNREVNTIASKSGNAEISQLVVEIKGQIEKIREQIQNIE